MKNTIILPFLFFISLSSRAQTIAGSWQGILEAGPQKLKIVFHVKSDTAHSYSSSFDSPDQHAFGVACSQTMVTGDSLLMGIKQINGGYQGKWDGKNNISGYFFQSGKDFPLVLLRTTDSSVAQIRPQTPKAPFPYRSEELEYDNKTSGIHYAGTLTYPTAGGPFPAVILITGSGQTDRDETLLGHKPFAVIADFLTRRGYAVLRVDDRQIGKSTGDILKATSKDFAADVETGLRYLQNRKEINQKKIGLAGHSEGGLIACIVAAENKNIDFVILLAGPGLRGLELMALQNEAYYLSLGVSKNLADAAKTIVSYEMQAVVDSPDSTRQQEQLWNSFSTWKKNADPAILNSLGLNNDSSARIFLQNNLAAMNKPWFAYFIQADPGSFIRQMHCKVLALNGSKDIQVLPDQNLTAIDSALRKSYSKIFVTQKIDGLNHLFQHCKTCTVPEYGELEETFAPEVLEIMSDWLDKNVK